MPNQNPDKHWKLKLRYGRLETPFQHFTVVADGEVKETLPDFGVTPGRAVMTMKVWADSTGEASTMIEVIGADIGFEVDGRVFVYDTDPEQPPRDNPFGYDIKFTPYDQSDEPDLQEETAT